MLLILINFVKETVSTILQLNDLLRLKLLHIVLVVRLLLRMVALVQHVGVIDALPAAEHFDLVLLSQLLCGQGRPVSITKQQVGLVLLMLLELGQFLLLRLHEDLLED